MSHKRERSPSDGSNPTADVPQLSQKKQRQSTQPIPQYQFNGNGSLTTRPIVRSASRRSEGPNYYTRERLIRRKDTPQPASTPPGIYGIIPLSPNTETLEDLPRSVVHPPLSGESVPSFNTSLEVDELRSLSMYHRNPENVQDVPPFIFLDQPISSYTFLPPAPQLNDHHSSPRGRAAINPPSIHTQTHNVPSPRQSFTGGNYISSQHQQDFYLTGPSLDLTQRYRAPEFDYRWYPQPSTESERDFVNDGKDGYP